MPSPGCAELRGLDRLLDHLESRSGQLRVRAALTLALGCGVLAYRFGFASILGAFAAGLLVGLIEISGHAPDPQFKTKLEGIGFGFLIPIFFITTGVSYQLKSLLAQPAAIAEVPLFVLALLLVRGLPALLYRRRTGTRRAAAAGLLQATTLTFVIVATQIGLATREDHADRGRLAGRRRAAHGRPVPRGGAAVAIPGHAGPWPQRQGFELSSGGKEHCDPGVL